LVGLKSYLSQHKTGGHRGDNTLKILLNMID